MGGQKYADVTIPMPKSGESGTIGRIEREKQRKYQDKLSVGEFFTPYVLSPYGAFGKEMHEKVWASSRRAARYLLGGRNQAGQFPASAVDRLGANIYQDFVHRVTWAVTEATINLAHKVVDSMIADLQCPLGIRSAATRWSRSQVVLLQRACRGEHFRS